MTVSRRTCVWTQQLIIAAALVIKGGLAQQFSPLATVTFTQVCFAPGYNFLHALITAITAFCQTSVYPHVDMPCRDHIWKTCQALASCQQGREASVSA